MNSHPGIEGILRQAIGLDPSSIGSPAIVRAMRARMQSLGLASPEDYGVLLQGSPDELQELIESIVVSETWFFRDSEPFAALARAVKNEWMPAHSSSTLRILSVPCATGEEPYSIAMALMDSGLPATRFRIDAVDVSLRVLDHARRGIYGRNSFRGADLPFRDRYFRHVEHGHLISEIVRERVDFRQGNLLAPDFARHEGLYDYIFCRNVLIYFDDGAQQRAVAGLKRLLAAGGLIFTGHAEVPLLTSRGFAGSEFPRAFACRKQDAPSKEPEMRERRRPARKAFKPAPPVPQPGRLHRPAATVIPASRPAQVDSAKPEKGKTDLETASRLADCGKLSEAADMCAAYLRKNPDSAKAHYLLGLIHDASGEDEHAARHYKKALYLEPDHCESLAHLAFLLEKQGDIAGAKRLSTRAGRSRQSSKVKT